jgi:hypothetical protein
MRYIFLVLCLSLPLIVNANHTSCLLLKDEPLILRDDAPVRYIVKPHDTLWSIASLYLKSPWQWKALWHANPSIQNPNRIYVGAILELHYVHHKTPYLKVISNGVIKLSPTMKVGANPPAVPAIPLKDIEPFLNKSFVLDQAVLNEAPYVLAFTGEHLMGGQGDEVYVNHLPTPEILPAGTSISYSIYRPNKIYFDPKTEQLLGYLASFIGNGDLVSNTRPAVLLLTNITEGVKIKDRVVLDDQPDFDPNFEPAEPVACVNGHIIDLLGNLAQAAVGYVAVVDRGANVGLRPGDVLGINARTRLVKDPMDTERIIKLPPKRIGEMMVFRVFAQTSFALIVRSSNTVHILDHATTP